MLPDRLHQLSKPDTSAWCLSLPRDNAWGNGTVGRGPCRDRMEPARLRPNRNGFIYFEGTSRALPASRKTRRFLYPKKAVGSCFGIRGPNSKSRAQAFRCIPRCADWPAMIGGQNGRRVTIRRQFVQATAPALRLLL